MHGQQQRVRFLHALARRAGASITFGAPRQLFEFVVVPRVAEYHFMTSSRENRSELATHQSRAQDANSHTPLLRLSFLFAA